MDFDKIEGGLDGTKRTSLYYCNPVKPEQKGAWEKNHVELKKIIPKGTDLDVFEQANISLACSHVNSYMRAGRGVAPITLVSAALPESSLENLRIATVAPDDVVMNPKLPGL